MGQIFVSLKATGEDQVMLEVQFLPLPSRPSTSVDHQQDRTGRHVFISLRTSGTRKHVKRRLARAERFRPTVLASSCYHSGHGTNQTVSPEMRAYNLFKQFLVHCFSPSVLSKQHILQGGGICAQHSRNIRSSCHCRRTNDQCHNTINVCRVFTSVLSCADSPFISVPNDDERLCSYTLAAFLLASKSEMGHRVFVSTTDPTGETETAKSVLIFHEGRRFALLTVQNGPLLSRLSRKHVASVKAEGRNILHPTLESYYPVPTRPGDSPLRVRFAEN
ncbi:unnamed protein product [Somion occarium]|uniref:Uncharacterized protein n=1 Tax=Somion occarium TaxID=3059160 RepID=A0ABP1E6T7_9APHY